MRYDYFYFRSNPNDAWRFDDKDAGTRVIARKIGCGCCSSEEEVSKKRLQEEIQELQERVSHLQRMLEENFS